MADNALDIVARVKGVEDLKALSGAIKMIELEWKKGSATAEKTTQAYGQIDSKLKELGATSLKTIGVEN